MTDARKRALAPDALAMKPVERIALAAIGLSSWIGGGVATFHDTNGPGAVALIAGGASGALLALIGRWPSRITVQGNEVAWLAEAIDESIEVAQSNGELEPVIAELKSLKDRLVTHQLTGVTPPHPAESFDQEVEQAIRSLIPDAELTRESRRSREAADFILTRQGRSVHIETKWRRDPNQPFRGRTLEPLARALRETDRLLVVVNARDTADATDLLKSAMPGRALVVSWHGGQDNAELKRGLLELLG